MDYSSQEPNNLKTIDELIAELESKLTAYFHGAGYRLTWPNNISEVMSSIKAKIPKLAGIYWDGFQDGFLRGRDYDKILKKLSNQPE